MRLEIAQDVGEASMGVGLMTLPLWSQILENIVAGSHVFTAIGGAAAGPGGVGCVVVRLL